MIGVCRKVARAALISLVSIFRVRPQTSSRTDFDAALVASGKAILPSHSPLPALPNSPHWSLTAACVSGTSHDSRQIPCQDAFCCAVLDAPDALIIAVSDGAGSARYSDQGSHVAVETVCEQVKTGLRSGEEASLVLMAAFRSAYAAIELVAIKMAQGGTDCLPGDLACTLIVAVLTGDRLYLGQIGDGVVVACNAGVLECLSRIDHGEYINETRFITTGSALDKVTIANLCSSEITSLAVMTDGVEHLSVGYGDRKPLDSFFKPIFGFAQRNRVSDSSERSASLARFLDSDSVNAETDDDKTLVIAVRQ